MHFIEQCTNYDNTRTLTWTQIPHTISHIPRGREPKWFRNITHVIKENLEDNNYNLVTPNPFTFTIRNTLEKGSWIIQKNTALGFIGKISSIKGQATVNHWILNNSNNRLQPCRGCTWNDVSLNKQKCTKKINIQQAQKILVDSKKTLRANREDIQHNEQNQTALAHTKPSSRLTKQHELIQQTINHLTTANFLQQLQQTCNMQKQITIQLIPKQQMINNIQQEIVICNIPSINQQFRILPINWPSTTKALISALTISLLIAADTTTVHIITNRSYFLKLANMVHTASIYDLYQIHHLNNWPSWLT